MTVAGDTKLLSGFTEAARQRDDAAMRAVVDQLRDHVRNEVWQLSKGTGDY